MAVGRAATVALTALVAAVLCGVGAANTATPGQLAAKARLVDTFRGKPDPVLVGPLSRAPLTKRVSSIGGLLDVVYTEEDGTRYRDNGNYVDLTGQTQMGAGLSLRDAIAPLVESVQPSNLGRELFRSPTVSFLYERGWRQQFNVNGFPGIDKEFDEVMSFFGPRAEGGTILDMSCGSGLMTRRLVASDKFARVIGADYSESMLRETAARFRSSRISLPDLVRCDVAALPMADSSVDAVHAGAAMHCWPDAEKAVVELCRVLVDEGPMFATTFLASARLPSQQGRGARGFRVFKEDELLRIFEEAGFRSVDVRKEGLACAIIKATK